MEKPSEKPVRLDKWLQTARIFKTRTRAHKACEERRITVNGEVAKSAKMIKVGDRITAKTKNRYRELVVLGIAFKSIPAREAKELYQEEKIQPLSENNIDLMKNMRQPKKAGPLKQPGRPTKKDRRNFIKIRGY